MTELENSVLGGLREAAVIFYDFSSLFGPILVRQQAPDGVQFLNHC
jgi:hypothetical protein